MTIFMLGISDEAIADVEAKERRELQRRERAYRGDRPAPDVDGRTVILVDDGLATGATMRAAVRSLRTQHPAELIVAVPTAAPETCAAFEDEVDQTVCAVTPDPFRGVGTWYQEFPQTSDQEVRILLQKTAEQLPA